MCSVSVSVHQIHPFILCTICSVLPFYYYYYLRIRRQKGTIIKENGLKWLRKLIHWDVGNASYHYYYYLRFLFPQWKFTVNVGCAVKGESFPRCMRTQMQKPRRRETHKKKHAHANYYYYCIFHCVSIVTTATTTALRCAFVFELNVCALASNIILYVFFLCISSSTI